MRASPLRFVPRTSQFLVVSAALVFMGCGDETIDPAPGGGGEGGTGGTGATGGTGGAGGVVDGGGGAGGEAPAWHVPACDSVSGSGAVTFTTDEGATLAPTSGGLTGVTYSFGLVALDIPNTLLLASGGDLLESVDAGCTWTSVGALPIDTLNLVAATGGVAYGYYDNQDLLVRIAGHDIEVLDPPGDWIHAVGVDPTNADHVRVLDAAGGLQESTDGGATWSKLGTPIAGGANALLYTAAFDPNDFDHVLVGMSNSGLATTNDAGDTWQFATGLGTVDKTNAFSVVFSTAQAGLVYVEGIDLGVNIGDEIRRIWRSTDGGASFTPIVAESAEVFLTNGVLLAPHPTDPDVMYFEFGTYYDGYGTDLYRYDQTTGAVTKTHNDYDDVSSIAFNPADPTVMYLGLTSEQGVGASP
ncbi:MAG: hypothetical protein U0271_35535 [Polyangiaceae bacterium]